MKRKPWRAFCARDLFHKGLVWNTERNLKTQVWSRERKKKKHPIKKWTKTIPVKKILDGTQKDLFNIINQ